MKEYVRIRKDRQKTSTVIGIALTVLTHVVVLCYGTFTGMKYIWPPPPENTFVLDFIEEEEAPKPPKKGVQPRSETVDKTKPIELVQKSESPHVSTKPNLTPETKQNDFGDIETPAPEPKEEPKLDPRAAFPGMAKKDTNITTPHSAEQSSNLFKAGHAQGNATQGNTEGAPNAHLKGRNTTGAIPRPSYTIQESGIVIVDIWVDQYGNVTKAVPGAEGTTVTNSSLWNAARKAAMNTHFEQKADAPALQHGTITYIFKLK